MFQPDITFFGEKLTDDFDNSLAKDRFRVDLLLVIGTSLKVSPVAEILCKFLVNLMDRYVIADNDVQHICLIRYPR